MRSRLRVRKAHHLELPTRQTMCEVICECGACCFASDGCPTADIDCADYMTCANIYGDLQDDDINGEAAGGNVEEGSNGNDDDVGGIVFKADIDDACINFDPAKESTADSKCAKLCARVGCCFLATGCDKEINCGVYKECDIIYATGAATEGVLDGSKTDGTGDDNLGLVFKVDVDDACVDFDPAEAGAGGGLCPKLCADAACCFTYAECDVLYEKSGSTSLTGLRATADEIIQACDSVSEEIALSANGESLCHALCLPYYCCFNGCALMVAFALIHRASLRSPNSGVAREYIFSIHCAVMKAFPTSPCFNVKPLW